MRMAVRMRTIGKALLIGAAISGSTLTVAADDNLPVKIGVLGDQSTIYASVGGQALIEAAKMAVEDFGGSALGKPIEVVSADTQLKPDIAATTAARWFDEENVDAVVDLPSTNIALSVKEIAEERKKILLVTSAASSSITGEECSPYVAHWTYDTYSNARSLGNVLIGQGGDKWFILNQDTATGTVVSNDLTQYVNANGGQVVGSVRAPVDATDFSSFILQAQSSGANVVAVTAAGSAGVTAIKQAVEFGLPASGIKMVSFFMMPDDVRAIGLEEAQGLYFTTAFPWDLNEEGTAFANRFLERTGKKPNMNMVGTYSAVSHYLAAVEAAGTKDADAVMAKMREMPIKDVFTSKGELRIDGRMAHSMFVVEVKSPAESTGEWDIMKIVSEVPTEEAVRPLDAGNCPLVK